MPIRIENSVQRRVIVCFLFFLPFTLLAVLTVSLFELSAAVRGSNVWVRHTLEVENAIGRLAAHLIEAESSARGFLLTNDQTFVADKEIAAHIQADVQRIESLTRDNTLQQRSATLLAPLVQSRLDQLRQLIDLQKKNPPSKRGRTSRKAKRTWIPSARR